MENILYFKIAFIFIVGACFGSFINAYSFRARKYTTRYFDKIQNLSFFNSALHELKLFRYSNKPKYSQCMTCKNKLKWYHNVPLFSFIFLGGKCGFCKTPYSSIYFLSEIFVGLIFVGIYFFTFNFFGELTNNFYITLGLLCFSFLIVYSSMIIDLKTQLIPDYTFVLTFLPLIYVSNSINNNYILNLNYNDIFSYIVLPFIFYFIFTRIVIGYFKITSTKNENGESNEDGRVLLGFGDIKLLSIIMILFGFWDTIIIYFISNYFAIMYIGFIYLKEKSITKMLPFGIYILLSVLSFPLYKNFIYEILNLNTF